MSQLKTFSELSVGDYFRFPGYDDLLKKTGDKSALNCGCGLLNKPTRIGRKGDPVKLASPSPYLVEVL